MSEEWFYIRLAFGLTWIVLAAYLVLLVLRHRSAQAALRRVRRGDT